MVDSLTWVGGLLDHGWSGRPSCLGLKVWISEHRLLLVGAHLLRIDRIQHGGLLLLVLLLDRLGDGVLMVVTGRDTRYEGLLLWHVALALLHAISTVVFGRLTHSVSRVWL